MSRLSDPHRRRGDRQGDCDFPRQKIELRFCAAHQRELHFAHMPTCPREKIECSRACGIAIEPTQCQQSERYPKTWRFRRSRFLASLFFSIIFTTAAEFRADNAIIIAS
jgi:hypothetical protein